MGDTGDDYASHAEVRFETCRVPQSNLLGEEGAGFVIAQERLGPGRIHHCMRWIGICERAFELMCERAAKREIAPGKPLGTRQTCKSGSPRAAPEIDAARLMVLHAAWKMDNEGAYAAREEISLIKFFVADVLRTRARSRHADARRARRHRRHAARDVLPARARRAHLRRPRRGAQVPSSRRILKGYGSRCREAYAAHMRKLLVSTLALATIAVASSATPTSRTGPAATARGSRQATPATARRTTARTSSATTRATASRTTAGLAKMDASYCQSDDCKASHGRTKATAAPMSARAWRVETRATAAARRFQNHRAKDKSYCP